MTHTHDLYHVLAGYGPTLANEGGVIFFTMSQSRMRRGLLAAFLWTFRPRVGWRRWHRYLQEGWQRGVGRTQLTRHARVGSIASGVLCAGQRCAERRALRDREGRPPPGMVHSSRGRGTSARRSDLGEPG